MSLSSIFSTLLIVLLMPFALRSEITSFVSTIVSEVGVEVSESNLLLLKLVLRLSRKLSLDVTQANATRVLW